jgi:hypothetical protein
VIKNFVLNKLATEHKIKLNILVIGNSKILDKFVDLHGDAINILLSCQFLFSKCSWNKDVNF